MVVCKKTKLEAEAPMPDINSHWIVPNAAIGLCYIPAISSEPYSLGAALAFTAGSLAPDIGDLGYWVKMWLRGKSHLPWNSKWSKRLFNHLDKHSWFAVPYHATHSLLFLSVVATIVYTYLPTHIAYWYVYGHTIHLLLDLPTHDRCWLLWPLKRTPMEMPFPNWYEWDFYRKNAREITIYGTPTNGALCVALLFFA